MAHETTRLRALHLRTIGKTAAFLIVLAFLIAGCATSGTDSYSAPANSRYRVLFAGLAQETNSFSPVPTTMDDFAASGIHRKAEVLEYAIAGDNTLSGFVSAIGDHGGGEIELVPVVSARAVSGGPIERETYETFKNEIVDAAAAQGGTLDGIYLALHGAMGVEGVRDPEGDLLEALRKVVGDEIPIGLSFDLHANITARRAELATFIVGYKTNPHRDFFDTGYSSGEIMARTVRGEIEPVMVVRKMRLLMGGGMNIDFISPMNRVFKRMDRMERSAEVLSVSNFMVHIWLDDPELGWSTVAVTDGNATLAAELADEIADMDWAVREVPPSATITAEEAVAKARRSILARAFGTTVICDVADAVGAGAPGENVWILKALMNNDPDLNTYIPVRDAAAVQTIWSTGVGEEVSVSVGGRLETTYNTSVVLSGRIEKKTESEKYGKTVVVRHQGIRVILTERPTTASSPDFFKDLGLPPRKAGVVVVKNLFPFRFTYIGVNRKTLNVLTPGTTSVDVFDLAYETISRPIYPLDDIEDWRQ